MSMRRLHLLERLVPLERVVRTNDTPIRPHLQVARSLPHNIAVLVSGGGIKRRSKEHARGRIAIWKIERRNRRKSLCRDMR